mgnify:FL=1
MSNLSSTLAPNLTPPQLPKCPRKRTSWHYIATILTSPLSLKNPEYTYIHTYIYVFSKRDRDRLSIVSISLELWHYRFGIMTTRAHRKLSSMNRLATEHAVHPLHQHEMQIRCKHASSTIDFIDWFTCIRMKKLVCAIFSSLMGRFGCIICILIIYSIH